VPQALVSPPGRSFSGSFLLWLPSFSHFSPSKIYRDSRVRGKNVRYQNQPEQRGAGLHKALGQGCSPTSLTFQQSTYSQWTNQSQPQAAQMPTHTSWIPGERITTTDGTCFCRPF
jgi:hypothetical protein